MTVSQDEKEFLVWYYKDFADPEEAYINVRLTGLEEKYIIRMRKEMFTAVIC